MGPRRSGDDGDLFCAEFVATLDRWELRLKDLRPPPTRFAVVVPQAARAFVPWPRWPSRAG